MKTLIANWKMNLTVPQAVDLIGRIEDGLLDLEAAHSLPRLIVAPPYTALSPLRDVLRHDGVTLAAQNCHWADSGSYTGEVSAPMLKGLASAVLLGHPERRKYGERDDVVARKVVAAARSGLTPIVFVGEDDEHDDTPEEAQARLKTILEEVNVSALPELVVVYEPLYASADGKPVASVQIAEFASALKEEVSDLGLQNAAILYGGGIDPNHSDELIQNSSVDGFVIGRAGLDPQACLRLVSALTE